MEIHSFTGSPRVNVFSALCFSVAVAVNHSLPATLAAILFPLALIVAARIRISRVLIRLGLVNGFIAFLWIFLPFSVPGETLYSIGPLHLTREGLSTALLVTAKPNAIVLATMALLGTSPVFDLAPSFHESSSIDLPPSCTPLVDVLGTGATIEARPVNSYARSRTKEITVPHP